ncbi:MAG: proteasome assembly chaperone family protein [Thermoplasmatota archaeon]|nr:PAC2 family protein [Halobacteriales archaeon]
MPAAKRPDPVADGPEPGVVETFAKVQLKDAVVLLAFPTAGSASSIAAQYLVRNLTLPLVGHFRLPELSGLVAIQDGRVTSAVRIFGGEVACRIGQDCPRIYLVTTELALPPIALARLADAVMDWAAAGGVHMLLVLEAVVRSEGDESPDVYVAAADRTVLASLRKAGLPPMERALIAGITAQILLDSPRRGLAAGGLLVEASRDHPDGRAAAALVQAVAKMVPDVVVDAGPLQKEAMELETEIQKAREQAQGKAPPPQASFI